MPTRIKIPDLGTTVDYVMIEKWRVNVGDMVQRGDILADIQTDKATAELESIAEGRVVSILAAEGQNVSIGEAVVEIATRDDAGHSAKPATTVIERGTAVTPCGGRDESPPLLTSQATYPERRRTDAGPSKIVSNLARKHAVDLALIAGTGRGGRITRDDVLRAAREGQSIVHPPVSVELYLSFYRQMVRIRQFEERVKFLFLEGKLPGTIHQCQGQEAVAVGVCAALQRDDVITSTHRPHGHALAKGLTMESLLHELFGKKTGCCRGKGGSMHIGDLEKGMVPAIAIVGGNAPVAAGIALAFKLRREPRVSVCFAGDGAVNEGAFHEALNMAAIWDLPVVYVVENNLYAASTSVKDSIALDRLSDRAKGYGIPGATIDGNDVVEVFKTVRDAVVRGRSGHGPALIDAVTYRITGHSRRDTCGYQPEEERRLAQEREPIGRFAAFLTENGHATDEQLAEIQGEVDAEISAAVESAMVAEDPRPEDALEDVFA